MSILCPNGVTIPPNLPSQECQGIYTADSCVVHQDSIVSLGLPANSSLETVVNTIVIALLFKQEQVESLEAQIELLTARIEALEE